MLIHNQMISLNLNYSMVPVVFLHAFPLNRQMWKPQFEMLEKEGIGYIAPDYPGFGESYIPEKELLMKDYADLISQLLREMHVNKALFVGVSMGGYVALSLLRYYPDLFKGLILSNTRASADDEQGRQKRFFTIENLKKDRNLQPIIESHLSKFLTAESRQKQADLVNGLRIIMQENSIEGVIQALRAMAERPDSFSLLQDANIPIAIIAGDRDELIPLHEAEKMKQQATGSTLHIIEGAAHITNLEKPEEFNRLLLDFYRKIVR